MFVLAHHAPLLGIQYGPQFLLFIAGLLAAHGVRLHLDFTNEELWIQAETGANRGVLRTAFWVCDQLNLELMDEQEAQVQETVGGTRIFLAQKCHPM